jgi:hypothetical protein
LGFLQDPFPRLFSNPLFVRGPRNFSGGAAFAQQKNSISGVYGNMTFLAVIVALLIAGGVFGWLRAKRTSATETNGSYRDAGFSGQ